jgi:hypothetical protein
MAIPNGVIFIWTGTNASIPAGWQRVTDLDDKFPKGNTDGSTNPNVTGGTSTHTHTSPSHTHTIGNHTHTVITNAGSGGTQNTGTGSPASRREHTHPNATSSNDVSATVGSATVTYGSVSNNPPYYDVIYITPTSTVGGIPNLSLGLSDDSGFTNNTGKYNGYYKCDGNNSTPDLTDKYLKGASAGGDAGTTGGSLTNVHNIDHTHTQSHTHNSLSISASTTGSLIGDAGPPNDLVNNNHTHTVTFNANTDSVVSSGLTVTTTETVEPAFKKLLAIQNRSGTIYTPVGIIGLWLGTIVNIPSNFEILSSMYDRHLKITNTNGDIGSTGGSNTHTHSNNAHTHAFSHTHTASINGHSSSLDDAGSAVNGGANNLTTHTLTINNSNVDLQSTNTSADSSSNEPEFRTVAFIKYKGEKGGSFIFNLLR